jgi:aminoglycoside 6'-N-acetyltransferase I
MIQIRPVTASDAPAWLRMRQDLWPEGTHDAEVAQFFAGALRSPLEVLLAMGENSTPVGFAELSIRPYAEGCETDRIAYLEGWYVEPRARRKGIGSALVMAAEEWGRAQGCTEFASDAEHDNDVSAVAHRALGFEDMGLIRCFKKRL